jgi:WhiB family redox-sensing transcriptional regulator
VNDAWFERVAAQLDECESTPDDALEHAVRYQGACGWLDTSGEIPEWTGDDRADRELAAPICAGCPVRRECLEWEFRTHGYAIAGVWGPLDAADRRAVYLHWLDRREDSAEVVTESGDAL